MANANADFLSRLRETVVASIIIAKPMLEQLIEAQREDEGLVPIINQLNTDDESTQRAVDGIAEEKASSYVMRDGVLHFRSEIASLIVVPASLRSMLMIQYHNGALGGHLSGKKTLGKLRLKYYWKNMSVDVHRWCKECSVCISRKGGPRPRIAPLQPIPVLPAPMELTAMDIIGPLPLSTNGNRYILVFMDYFTKWPEAFALKDQTAATIAKVFVEDIIFRYGAPKRLLTDKGLNFTSKLVQAVNEVFGILKLNTSAYHPQTDGMVERFNRTLLDMLAAYTNSGQTDWDIHLPSVLFAYRTAKHATTHESPFYMMYLRDTCMPIDLNLEAEPNLTMEVNDFLTIMKQRMVLAKAVVDINIQTAQSSYCEDYDKKAKPFNFAVGDQVVILTPKPKKGISPKLQRLYNGPFEVLDVTPPTIKVKLISRKNAQPQIIHANRCRLVTSNRESKATNITDITSPSCIDEEVVNICVLGTLVRQPWPLVNLCHIGDQTTRCCNVIRSYNVLNVNTVYDNVVNLIPQYSDYVCIHLSPYSDFSYASKSILTRNYSCHDFGSISQSHSIRTFGNKAIVEICQIWLPLRRAKPELGAHGTYLSICPEIRHANPNIFEGKDVFGGGHMLRYCI